MSYFEDFLRARDPQKTTKKPAIQTGDDLVDIQTKSEDLERASITKVLSEKNLQGGISQDAIEKTVDQTGDNLVDNQSKSEDLERASITKTLSQELPPLQSPSPTQYSTRPLSVVLCGVRNPLNEEDGVLLELDKRSVATASPRPSRVGGSGELSVRDLPDRPPSAPECMSTEVIQEIQPIDSELDLDLTQNSSLSAITPESQQTEAMNFGFEEDNGLTTPSGIRSGDEESLESTGAIAQSPPPPAFSYLSQESNFGRRMTPSSSDLPLISVQPQSERIEDEVTVDKASSIDDFIPTMFARRSTRVSVESKQSEERRTQDPIERPDIKGSFILAGIFTGIAALIGTIFSKKHEF